MYKRQPLLQEERASWKIFGNYFHTYYYDKSIQDGYTLKIIREDIETKYKEKLSEIYEKLETLVQKKDIHKSDIIEHDTYVKEFNLEGEYVKVKRALEDGYEVLKVKLPCVLTAIKELNEPRYMSVPGILKAAKADIKVWNAEDIGVDLKTVGLKASPTNVFKSFTPKPKGAGVTVEGDTPREKAENLVAALKEKHII